MTKIIRSFLLLPVLILLNSSLLAQTTVISDNLQGSTLGAQVGGSFSADGYKPGVGSGHILYDVPTQVINGYVEFQIKGFAQSLVPANADNGLVGLYDGRGITEPILYFDDFKENFFRWNFHWRQNRNIFKGVISCAAPTSNRLNATKAVYTLQNSPPDPDRPTQPKRDWGSEPLGTTWTWDVNTWYTIRVEWNNKTFRGFVNGQQVWIASGPYDYAPIDFKIWLGSAPGDGLKYINHVASIVYRNFKLVSYGAVNNNAPVITSAAVTNGTVGQLYSYDVNATGNPAPTFSLVTKPTGMTINSTTGLIQWTPTTTGPFNVTVKAANGVTPDATQSFAINVQSQQQNIAPVITSTAVVNGTVGQLYNYDVNATGNPTPTFSLVTFPSGMTINATTGLIQWTPTTTGQFNVSAKAANGVLPDATQSFVINVQSQNTAPVITSTAVINGTVGQLYNYDVNATGNPTPTFSLVTFPSGMTINPTTGLIQWTPTTTGQFNVSAKAANGVNPDATQSFIITVQAAGGNVIVLQDNLQGNTIGTQVGGSFSTEGFRPGVGNNHILYNVPAQVINGYMEFQIKGFAHSLVPTNAENGFVGMYDGRGITEPVAYVDDFRWNFFRWDLRWRQNRAAFKSVMNCAAPTPARLNATKAVFPAPGTSDWGVNLTGSGSNFNANNWYTFKLEWNNKNFKVFVDGAQVWATSGPYDYAPINFRIWLGSMPGSSNQNSVANIVYRNFKLVKYNVTQEALTKLSLSSDEIFNNVENQVNGNTIRLNWQSSVNVSEGKFEIERSENSESGISEWQKIGEVGIIAGVETKTFAYNDNVSVRGQYTYRIKFVNDGSEVFSKQVEAEVLPTEFELSQNYPNPFNPTTKIRFSVPLASKVTLQVYNQLGEVVSQPVSNVYEAGNYEVTVDMSGLSSGVYFYKITAGNFSDIKKMMLTK